MIADERSFSLLLVRARTGDRAAYAALLGESARWLSRYFRRKVAPDRIDDLVQDTLLSVHAKLASHDPSRAYLPWLAAIARYRWVDQLRRHYRDAAETLPEQFGDSREEEEAVAARLSLDRLLAQLSPAQAEAIALVKIEGRSIMEASAATGQSESLVKVNIHRGLRKLARLVEEAE